MKNQPYYDRLISFNPNAVSEEEALNTEIEFTGGSAFKLFRLMLAGGFIGWLLFMFFGA